MAVHFPDVSSTHARFQRCWSQEPEERPTFSSIVGELSSTAAPPPPAPGAAEQPQPAVPPPPAVLPRIPSSPAGAREHMSEAAREIQSKIDAEKAKAKKDYKMLKALKAELTEQLAWEETKKALEDELTEALENEDFDRAEALELELEGIKSPAEAAAAAAAAEQEEEEEEEARLSFTDTHCH